MGRGEHGGPRRDALLGHAGVDVPGCQEAEARVSVLGVVPDSGGSTDSTAENGEPLASEGGSHTVTPSRALIPTDVYQ